MEGEPGSGEEEEEEESYEDFWSGEYDEYSGYDYEEEAELVAEPGIGSNH